MTKSVLKLVIQQELDKAGIKDGSLADKIIESIELAFKIEAEISARNNSGTEQPVSAVKAPVPSQAVIPEDSVKQRSENLIVLPNEANEKPPDPPGGDSEDWERGLAPDEREATVKRWMQEATGVLMSQMPGRLEVQSNGRTVVFVKDVKQYPQTECVQISYRPESLQSGITAQSGPTARPQPGSFHGKMSAAGAQASNEIPFSVEVRKTFSPVEKIDPTTLAEQIKTEAAKLVAPKPQQINPIPPAAKTVLRIDPSRDFAEGVADEAD